MITLTAAELQTATALGTVRWRVLKDQSDAGSNHYHGTPQERLDHNIQGAIGEFGAAKFFGLPEPTSDHQDPDRHDIGDRTDVKSIHSDAYNLVIVAGRVHPERLYMLALVIPPNVWLQGFRLGAWILARPAFYFPDGLRDYPGEAKRPCWKVPQAELLRVDGLTADLL